MIFFTKNQGVNFMKLRYLLLCAVMGFLTVSAETTLELLQQRAEAGDATAQTFLGMAYQYGYGVSAQKEKAIQWFSRAALQGDAYAAMRRDSLNDESKMPVSDMINLRTVNFSDLKARIEQADYAGSISFDELAMSREQYLGKTVELSFTTLTVIGGPNGNPCIYIRDPKSYGSQGGTSDRLYLFGDDAMKWKLVVDKKPVGSSSRVYALVEKDGLVALGERKRKTDSGYVYSW